MPKNHCPQSLQKYQTPNIIPSLNTKCLTQNMWWLATENETEYLLKNKYSKSLEEIENWNLLWSKYRFNLPNPTLSVPEKRRHIIFWILFFFAGYKNNTHGMKYIKKTDVPLEFQIFAELLSFFVGGKSLFTETLLLVFFPLPQNHFFFFHFLL